jgi:hypothetical protein
MIKYCGNKRRQTYFFSTYSINVLPTHSHDCLCTTFSSSTQTHILRYDLSTIFTSHHHHQPQPPTEPSNQNSMSSRQVKSFSTTRIGLLSSIEVTFETSHRLRSPLKARADKNTAARKEDRFDYIHS